MKKILPLILMVWLTLLSMNTAVAATISGRIYDSRGVALTSIPVQAYIGRCAEGFVEGTTTDGSGFYTLTVPAGSYYINTWIDPPAFYHNFVNWAEGGVAYQCGDADPVEVAESQNATGIDMQLLFGGSISGTINAAVGGPSSPLAVNVFEGEPCGEHRYITGYFSNSGEATYHISGIPEGTYFLRTDPSGTDYVAEYWNVSASSTNCSDAQTVTVVAGTALTGYAFQLEEGGYIAGNVKDTGNNPIPNLWMEAFSDKCRNSWAGGASTDENGDFRIGPLTQGSYYVDACTECTNINFVQSWWKLGGATMDCNDAEAILVTPGATNSGKNFQLQEGGIVTGTIDHEEGVSLQVVVYGGDPCGEIVHITSTWSDPQDGTFAIKGVPAGSFYLRTWPGDTYYIGEWWSSSGSSTDCADAQTFSVVSGQTVSGYDFHLEEGGILTGTVYEADGITPISGFVSVDVNAGDPCGEHEYVTGVWTDEDAGTYTIHGVPSGTYFLRTSPLNTNYMSEFWNNPTSTTECSAAEMVIVTAGETLTGFDFQLEQGGTISGHVYRQDDGNAIESVHVFVTDADTGQWLGGRDTDAEGVFVISGLPAGDCRVNICPSCNDLVYVDEFYNDTYNYGEAARITVAPGSDITLDDVLLVEGNTVSGTISGLEPDQWVHVDLSCDNGTPEGEDDFNFGRGYPADASGNVAYTITVLPGYLYRVGAYPDGDPNVYYVDGNPAGTFAWQEASIVDPTTNPTGINVTITQGVQLSGTVNGLGLDQHLWISAHCENGTPSDDADDFGFGMDLWGSGTGSDPYSIAVPPGYTYRACFFQDNGIAACYDGTEDGAFGGIDPNVAVSGDVTLDPLTLNPGVSISGAVVNLDPHQTVRIFAHSDAGTPGDDADDFSPSDPFNADENGSLDYSLTVPQGYSYIIEFQPEYMASRFFLSGDGSGTDDRDLATVIAADTNIGGVDLAFPPRGSITGRVISNGEPVSGLWVEVWAGKCWDTWLNGANTDENGFYTVDNLPAGDVYFRTCAECNQQNFIDLWYTPDGGTGDCNAAVPVSVMASSVTELNDFDLEIGPQRENWTEVSVYDGVLGCGFDLRPGFDDLIVSASLLDPNGVPYEFDIENDTFQWLNDCYYNKTMWWKDLTAGEDIVYGEYRLTLRFRDGYEKTYVHNLQNIDIQPVVASTMNYTVNADGSIDFTFANPDPDPANPSQWHRIMVYDASANRLLNYRVQPQNTAVYNVHVDASNLRCLQIGESYSWHIRAHDLNDPYNVTHRTFGLGSQELLAYNPTSLDNRVTNFSVTRALTQDKLWLYFNTRPGSRNDITSATVSGPDSFSYSFDLVNDWFDISTETRINKGWNGGVSLPAVSGAYSLSVLFHDGHLETRTADLAAAAVVPVDVSTIQAYMFDNGAGYVTWELPAGGTGQYYQVRLRSADGQQEFYASGSKRDGTSQYASPWDLRALVPGSAYQVFVRAYDATFTNMAQSSSVISVYDAFDLFPKPDIDKDWDVDGSDLATIAQLMLDGRIDDIPEAMAVIAQHFGRVQ